MITGTHNQIDVDAIIRDARAARAALVRSFFSRIFSRGRRKVAATVSAPARSA